MKRIARYSLIISASTLSLAAAAPVAFAQEGAAVNMPESGIADIVVTAQKRSENIQNVAISIAAFSGESLENNNVVSIGDLGKIVPNFTASTITQIAATRVSIRGVGTFGNNATEPSAAVFLDGVYVPRAGSVINNFLDIEGVEVLRGPQGTLFGRNASVSVVRTFGTDGVVN